MKNLWIYVLAVIVIVAGIYFSPSFLPKTFYPTTVSGTVCIEKYLGEVPVGSSSTSLAKLECPRTSGGDIFEKCYYIASPSCVPVIKGAGTLSCSQSFKPRQDYFTGNITIKCCSINRANAAGTFQVYGIIGREDSTKLKEYPNVLNCNVRGEDCPTNYVKCVAILGSETKTFDYHDAPFTLTSNILSDCIIRGYTCSARLCDPNMASYCDGDYVVSCADNGMVYNRDYCSFGCGNGQCKGVPTTITTSIRPYCGDDSCSSDEKLLGNCCEDCPCSEGYICQ